MEIIKLAESIEILSIIVMVNLLLTFCLIFLILFLKNKIQRYYDDKILKLEKEYDDKLLEFKKEIFTEEKR